MEIIKNYFVTHLELYKKSKKVGLQSNKGGTAENKESSSLYTLVYRDFCTKKKLFLKGGKNMSKYRTNNRGELDK